MDATLTLTLPVVPRSGGSAYLGYATLKVVVNTLADAVLVTVFATSLDEDEALVNQITLETLEGELRVAVDTHESLLELSNPPETSVLHRAQDPFPTLAEALAEEV